MLFRALLFAALLPVSALAQIQVFLFDGANETPVGAVLDVGAVSTGAAAETRLRVRNTGTESAILQTLSLAGTGFTISAAPSLPYTLAPYTGSSTSEAEIRVTFNPTAVASYTGFLVLNTVNIVLQGTGSASTASQIQVFLFDGTQETSVGAVVDVGGASPGDTVETRFRVRNIGNGPAVLQTLSLGGSGFTFSATPSLPYTLAPYTGSPISEAEFRVTFNPTDVASYSAFLLVNTINVILKGTGTPSAVLTLEDSTIPLAANAIIDFGSVAAGQTKLLTFNLTNPANSSVTVGALTVTGAGFKGPIGPSAPVTVAPGEKVSFQVAFQPVSGLNSQGTLALDQRSFVLTGQGLSPPLPGASIVFGSSAGQSAQQNNVSIPLASASQVGGTGTLTMTFQSDVQNVADDPAIQFLSGPLRHATVTISVGAKTAKFDGSQPDLAFQTGTTAGTITFDLTVNGESAGHATLTIAPAAVALQTSTSVRRLGALDVSITAFDNTYSASQLAFTFFDKTGATMQPGVIRVDATSDFRLYFDSTKAGGAFALLATFPVTGDTSQIASTTVGITNSVGVTTTQHITIGN